MAKIVSISLKKLIAHPMNPNHMSNPTFGKLVANIERTGNYEPIIVRVHPSKKGSYQIINGHHRVKAIEKLNRKKADCIIWDVDTEQAAILLMTLNRLSGRDAVDKKIALLKRLNETIEAKQLGKVLPQTAGQIEKLMNLKLPDRPAGPTNEFALAVVFFLSGPQKQTVETALETAVEKNVRLTKPQRNALGLVTIAEHFIKTAKDS
jgi:uncharacterized ParB-like nuclease family protein